ncbi:undecaprenyl/decaprenyl-phosphate alpha-N-acetylglucosaminyl 1-phosphate transferase [Acidobacteria bacterium AH-259-O06]|nr:undecaprenyl/decaprenyl-phosphate alpha-N-acetylglucosaminyl 1-phosphate transferase [Acidobacteria bacterium AH-259-O06]
MIIYLFLFLVSLGSVSLLTPLSIKIAGKIGAVDIPTERKVHKTPVPRLGGVAVILSVAIALLLGAAGNVYISRIVNTSLMGMVAGSMVIIAVGLWDDTRNANPFLKLACQLIAAVIAVSMGVQFELASNPLVGEMRDFFDLGVLAFPLSVLWIVFLTNAMNLIDGLDGLACGIALFTSMTLFLISVNIRAGDVTYFYIALAGATLGFLRYNRFPAKVFLGDTGSMFLGFSLGCLSITGFQKSFTLSSLVIPMIIFGIPIFDSALALTRRYVNGRGLTTADREHLHHRLIDLGLSQRQAVLLLYFVTVLLGIIAFAFTVQLNEYAAVVTVVIGVVGGLLAKELNLFGTQVRKMEREFMYEKKQKSLFEGIGVRIQNPESRSQKEVGGRVFKI